MEELEIIKGETKQEDRLNEMGILEVWEVRLWKIDPSNSQSKSLVSSSRVTLLSNMAVPEHANEAGEKLKKYAKL
ncbi:1,4-dihydroxy-2-naphthoyl-CoA thioesterase 1 [Quercus suber]|uniref:1,4-dihydroxy-2-naphthoyl-CoA thioesterase 1 n=1 Tax=Quercus suber TaxID=58331 RepID=A0AAW0M3H8_QUESU